AIGSAAGDDGPYAAFNAAVAGSTRSAYERGPLARLCCRPEAVARAIDRAISARSPRIRYRVTPSAHLLIGLHGLMTAGLWDRFLTTQFPRADAYSESATAALVPAGGALGGEPYGGSQKTSTCRSSATEWKRCTTPAPTYTTDPGLTG